MKKIIIGTLAVASMLLATDGMELKSNLFDLNKVKNEEMKGFLSGLETSLPFAAKVLKDYYEAKTCNKEFYNEISMDDIKEFVPTAPHGALIALSILNSGKKEDARDNSYSELINTYKFMNCSEGTLPNREKYGLKEETK